MINIIKMVYLFYLTHTNGWWNWTLDLREPFTQSQAPAIYCFPSLNNSEFTNSNSTFDNLSVLKICHNDEECHSVVRCQFHQHFTSSIFIWKSIEQLFCTYHLGLYFFGARKLARRKEIGAKAARKMLVILTTIGCVPTENFQTISSINLFFQLELLFWWRLSFQVYA